MVDGAREGTSERIGPYAILRRLGHGGSSEVLLATESGPFGYERTVVVKRLLPAHRTDPAMQKMLVHEATAYARLSHPSIVRMYELRREGNELALVLEHVPGITLARLRTTLRARGQRLGDEAAYYLARRIFAALAAAHAAKDPRSGAPAPIVHRDVSPGNVLVPPDGFVKLTDFGIAKVPGTDSDTHDGLIKGTDGYMAPEQVKGGAITPATDVYAGCLLLRELLIGKATFSRGALSELEYLRAMAEPQIPAIEASRPDLPREITLALARGLMPDPAARTLAADEMVTILAAVSDPEKGHAALVRVAKTIPEGPPFTSAPTNPGSVNPRAMTMGTPYAYVPSPLPASASPASLPTPPWVVPAAAAMLAGLIVSATLAAAAPARSTSASMFDGARTRCPPPAKTFENPSVDATSTHED